MNHDIISIHISTLLILLFSLLPTLICVFLTGYLLGRHSIQSGVINTNQKPVSFFKQTEDKKQQEISIDSSKVVTDIKTDNLEKKYESLGEIKKSDEDISQSINKLKNIKR